MLYDQAKRDVFSSGTSSPNQDYHDNKMQDTPVNAPSVTTIVLLQVQASMIQVISKLKVHNKGIQNVVQVPIRWGLLFGLLVVDNVARALQVDQEMAFIQHSEHSDERTITEEDDDVLSVEDLSIATVPTPQRSQSATTHRYHQPRPMASMSSSPPSSPLFVIRPPLVSQSSDGLRVRLRKSSSPPILSNIQQRPLVGRTGHVRSLSNNDGRLLPKVANKPLPTVRRVIAQRDLSSVPSSPNGLRRKVSLHDLNAEQPIKRSQQTSSSKVNNH
ncbi:uncharacterized protein BX664DRAFT_328621 [Halteromyces radiatus]|uniref:uncharacterized protein n=1 Tax=Halteromyces radiatus TaxID=101107 RepID=UPI002220B5E8|nr:uncharacterized protein BX664DRAFT_328621 [Halteromyces radiatus]KAI8092972.1 hypothetical protein BX664DRAFT_328621 [Halteromyces radiatus]